MVRLAKSQDCAPSRKVRAFLFGKPEGTERMAKPKTVPTKLQQDQTRAAIQTTQLVKRLQNFALGLPEANSRKDDAKPVELDGAKLKAIEILLRKSLPDLSAVDLTTGGGKLELPTAIGLFGVEPNGNSTD